MAGFSHGGLHLCPLLGTVLVATLTNWKVDGKKVLALMVSSTAITFGLAITAWWQVTHGPTSAFWTQLHGTYWRLYVIFGALAVPAGCWILRDRSA
jgi:hypothetical protein